jgi:hypothetical protein
MSPSVSAVSSPSIGVGDRSFRASAPEHRVNFSDSSSSSSFRSAPSHSASSDGQHATPRPSPSGNASSGSASSGSGSASSGARTAPPASGQRAVARGTAASNGAAGGVRANDSTAGRNNASGTSEVPSWARSRGDHPGTDTAVDRVGPRPPRSAGDRTPSGGGGYYDPYYYGGFGYGFAYSAYCSPMYVSCNQGFYGYPFYSPFGFGYGIPSGYFDPFYSDPYDYGAGYGAYSSRVYGGHDQGSLKLKVKPRNAKVYVDGYYAGVVDDFDGAFQKLTLNGGRHKVELRADGYETTEFDVLITPEQTVTFSGDMKKVQ